MLDLQLARWHRWERAAATGLFAQARDLGVPQLPGRRTSKASSPDGASRRGRRRFRWTGPSSSVTVAAAREGHGIGDGPLAPRWPRPCRTPPPPSPAWSTTSMSGHSQVARHWGYAVEQHGIRSQMDLVDLPEPVLPDDVTVEDATASSFPDADAVESMLVDSQTNPEAVQSGIITRLADLRLEQAEVEHPFAVLARVGGTPAAIITREIQDAILLINYTGVGQGLPRPQPRASCSSRRPTCTQQKPGRRAATRPTRPATPASVTSTQKLGYQVVAGDSVTTAPKGA